MPSRVELLLEEADEDHGAGERQDRGDEAERRVGDAVEALREQDEREREDRRSRLDRHECVEPPRDGRVDDERELERDERGARPLEGVQRILLPVETRVSSEWRSASPSLRSTTIPFADSFSSAPVSARRKRPRAPGSSRN